MVIEAGDAGGEGEAHGGFEFHIDGGDAGAGQVDGVAADLVAHGQVDGDGVLAADAAGQVVEGGAGDQTEQFHFGVGHADHDDLAELALLFFSEEAEEVAGHAVDAFDERDAFELAFAPLEEALEQPEVHEQTDAEDEGDAAEESHAGEIPAVGEEAPHPAPGQVLGHDAGGDQEVEGQGGGDDGDQAFEEDAGGGEFGSRRFFVWIHAFSVSDGGRRAKGNGGWGQVGGCYSWGCSMAAGGGGGVVFGVRESQPMVWRKVMRMARGHRKRMKTPQREARVRGWTLEL